MRTICPISEDEVRMIVTAINGAAAVGEPVTFDAFAQWMEADATIGRGAPTSPNITTKLDRVLACGTSHCKRPGGACVYPDRAVRDRAPPPTRERPLRGLLCRSSCVVESRPTNVHVVTHVHIVTHPSWAPPQAKIQEQVADTPGATELIENELRSRDHVGTGEVVYKDCREGLRRFASISDAEFHVLARRAGGGVADASSDPVLVGRRAGVGVTCDVVACISHEANEARPSAQSRLSC